MQVKILLDLIISVEILYVTTVYFYKCHAIALRPNASYAFYVD